MTRDQLEKRRLIIEADLVSKLEVRDYHGVADAAMDLREIEARISMLEEWPDRRDLGVELINRDAVKIHHEFVMSSSEAPDA